MHEKVKWDEKDAAAITDSVLQSFHSKIITISKIVLEELIKGRMKFFSNNIQSLQVASSIRDIFISPDQKMCSYVSGEENTYQLSTNKTSKPNSLISNTNIASLLNNQRDRLLA